MYRRPMSEECKIRHLQMIQDTITRMASNSFQLKCWCIVLVTCLIGVSAAEGFGSVLLLGCLPVVMMWILDAYYLDQERRFRRLYDEVRLIDEGMIDFSMCTVANEMGIWDVFDAFISKTESLFYGTFIVSMLSLYVIFC